LPFPCKVVCSRSVASTNPQQNQAG
jgi:hypothetical protein